MPDYATGSDALDGVMDQVERIVADSKVEDSKEPQANGNDIILEDYNLKDVEDDTRQELSAYDKDGPVNNGVFEYDDTASDLEAEDKVTSKSPTIALVVMRSPMTNAVTSTTYEPLGKTSEETIQQEGALSSGNYYVIKDNYTLDDVLLKGYKYVHGSNRPAESFTGFDRLIYDTTKHWEDSGYVEMSALPVGRANDDSGNELDCNKVCTKITDELKTELIAAGYKTSDIDGTLTLMGKGKAANDAKVDYLIGIDFRQNKDDGAQVKYSKLLGSGKELAEQLALNAGTVAKLYKSPDAGKDDPNGVLATDKDVMLSWSSCPSVILEVDKMANMKNYTAEDSIASLCGAIVKSFQTIDPVE